MYCLAGSITVKSIVFVEVGREKSVGMRLFLGDEKSLRTMYNCITIENRSRKNRISTVRDLLSTELRMVNLWIENSFCNE